jgi:hypothetical protein
VGPEFNSRKLFNISWSHEGSKNLRLSSFRGLHGERIERHKYQVIDEYTVLTIFSQTNKAGLSQIMGHKEEGMHKTVPETNNSNKFCKVLTRRVMDRISFRRGHHYHLGHTHESRNYGVRRTKSISKLYLPTIPSL